MKELDHQTDVLLKTCLQSDAEPDSVLNEGLKRKLFAQSARQRSVSLWWLPMLLSVLTSGMVSTLSFLLISSPTIQAAVLLFSCLTGLTSVLLTFIGIKSYGLKKGALVAL